MSGKIFSGEALMLVARVMRNVAGFIAARIRIAATTTSRIARMTTTVFIELSIT